MAQPTPIQQNGASSPVSDDSAQLAVPSKRKRDQDDEGDEEMSGVQEQKSAAPRRWPAGEQKQFINSYFEVLKRLVCSFLILRSSVPIPRDFHRPPS